MYRSCVLVATDSSTEFTGPRDAIALYNPRRSPMTTSAALSVAPMSQTILPISSLSLASLTAMVLSSELSKFAGKKKENPNNWSVARLPRGVNDGYHVR
jgi:hypothetical protein